ncbi:substrate-binding domain-containing protein [Streptomyces litchfieldiae]|uniref:Substrate-binding domain-containing protein n=1 Tax=Streptomyces litchfieldiae TaxID=3075543 RepID=A0ABU2MK07_9ACTN|nr:substrate-binding domain-containing protein [Streptomyces sp. DSM 44938]MDT0341943.1 substrate-binding domain-containing protein [Streptomyces sp. DSM 44938]
MERGAMAAGGSDDASRVPAVSRAVSVLDDIARNGPATLADLARRLALPKSSLLSICQALLAQRLLAQGSGGRYTLGLGVAELAAAELEHPPRLAVLGVSLPNAENPFYAVELDGIRQAAAELGAQVVTREAGGEVTRQIEQLRELVRAGADAVVLDAVHSTEVAGAVAEAEAAGVRVIAVNVGAEGAGVTVTTDNIQAGQSVGHYLAALLGGHGEVGVVDGLHVTAVADRIVGFVAALRDYPGIRVVARQRGDHSPRSGERAARRILAAHPGLSGMFSVNDPMAEGALAAMSERSVSVPLVSVDGSAAAAAAIAAGGPWRASAAQEPARLGRLAVRYAARLLSQGARPPGPVRLLPTRLITQADVADYEPWG